MTNWSEWPEGLLVRSAHALQFPRSKGAPYAGSVLGVKDEEVAHLCFDQAQLPKGWKKSESILSDWNLVAGGRSLWSAALWWSPSHGRRELSVVSPDGSELGVITPTHPERWPLRAGVRVVCDGQPIAECGFSQWSSYRRRGAILESDPSGGRGPVLVTLDGRRDVRLAFPAPVALDAHWCLLSASAIAWMVGLGQPRGGA